MVTHLWLRRALAGLGAIALTASLWGGLTRLGFALPAGTARAVHGPVMVLGAIGTLVALERAVALARPSAYVAPAASGIGALVLLAGGPYALGKGLLGAAGVGLVAVFVHLYRRQPEVHFIVMGLGAVLWPAAVAVWAVTGQVPRATPWLVGFLVLTIVGERVELSRLSQPTPAARTALLATIGLFVAGLLVGLAMPAAGVRIAGVSLLSCGVWLVRHDLAPRLSRRDGATRFVGLTLTTGYVWLIVAGALWLWAANATGGPTYDAAVHAVFLGFVMSMIFGHAPVILPAVLRVSVPFHPALYLPVALLHATLAVRVAGDLFGAHVLVRWGGVGNIVAVVGFLATVAITAAVRRAQHSSSRQMSSRRLRN